MVYRLTHSFLVDAFGQPVAPPPRHGMAAAARYYHAHDLVQTERCCRELLLQEPRDCEALHLLGVVCIDQARFAEARDLLALALIIRPDDPEINYHQGTALLGAEQTELAAEHFRKTLALSPNNIRALNNLGTALNQMQCFAEAVECFRSALQISPDFAPAHYNLGRSLMALDQPDEAVLSFRTALAHSGTAEPARMLDIYASLGEALTNLGRYEEALAVCDAIAKFSTGQADWNASAILLLQGNYAEGWRRYEGRWTTPDHDAPHPRARVPALHEVAGRRVFLVCEQGHGDIIQFARYAPLLARAGADVTLQVYPEELLLMQSLDHVTVVANTAPEPAAEIVTPLLSLPLVFGTTLATVPADVPYLHVPPHRLHDWQQRLGAPSCPRVGLFWFGSQHIPQRSMTIQQLEPLLRRDDVEFHALQLELPAQHHEWMQPSGRLADHRDALHDFTDTAALIMQLDLVITIDTAVAHLAGALGKPTWIMLPFNADWRWLLDRTDTPWYPTARLFRQSRRGDWASVVTDVTHALADWSRRL